jgi:hypothetical protein
VSRERETQASNETVLERARGMDMTEQRDTERNTAFFLGAFGTALGVLGGGLSLLGIVTWLWPDFAQTAPDWFFFLVVVGLMVLMVGAWPALDWLVNHCPVIGGPVVAISGLLLIAIGAVAVLWTAWGPTGWLAIAGGLILLPAAYLALVGGGTEPLTWRALHRRSQTWESPGPLAGRSGRQPVPPPHERPRRVAPGATPAGTQPSRRRPSRNH